MPAYRALGFDLVSDIPLPWFAEVSQTGTRPVISLVSGEVPEHLDQPVVQRPLLEIDAGRACLFSVPGLARFFIPDDTHIVMEAAPDLPPDRLVGLLGLTPMAVLCYRHGLLPLAASAVRVGGKALIFGGGPATGKTALSMALVRRGHGFMADTLCALDASGPDGPCLWPAWPRAALWPDCLDALAPGTQAEPLFPGGRVPVIPPGAFHTDPAPVLGLIIRARTDGIASRTERLRGYRVVQELSRQMWMDDLCRHLAEPANVHAALTHCARTIPHFEHVHPDGLDGLEAELDDLLGLVQARQ